MYNFLCIIKSKYMYVNVFFKYFDKATLYVFPYILKLCRNKSEYKYLELCGTRSENMYLHVF